MTDSIIQHLLENKKHTANHRNSKKTTTFVFSKRSVTSMQKCPISQHVVSDSGHSTKWLKEGDTIRICKTAEKIIPKVTEAMKGMARTGSTVRYF